MKLYILILLLTTISKVKLDNSTESIINNKQYDPELLLARILGYNGTSSRQSGYGFVSFEDQLDTTGHKQSQSGYGLIKFEDQLPGNQENGQMTFEDQGLSLQQNPQPKPQKKRRRRKRPRFQQLPGQAQLYPYPGIQPVVPVGYPLQQVPGTLYPAPYPRPYRRRKAPSFAEDALASVTRALGSIAQYDDFQCVPRLLCEVAGGKSPGSQQTSSVLPSFVDLQPLITLLAAFNGLSTSPLFVFGRAVFLGVTSKGNTGTCRYAYPLCPTDPDKLVDYLNNHNGGFFRFFNGGPPPQYPNGFGQQNLQQFYNHLSNIPGSNGYPQDLNIQTGGYNPQINQQYYGLQPTDAEYGLYNPASNGNQFSYQNNYGPNYPYQPNPYRQKNLAYQKVEEDIGNNEIQKRIQNRPEVIYVDSKAESTSNEGSKWIFPEINTIRQTFNTVTKPNKDFNRITKSLKFPQEDKKVKYISYDESLRQGKGFQFPEQQSNRQYIDYYNYPPLTMLPNGFDADKIKYDDEGYYIDYDNTNNAENGNNNDANEDGVEIIYVLRGNGDPNNPEIVKLRPGQMI